MFSSNYKLLDGEKCDYSIYIHWSNPWESGKNYLIGKFSVIITKQINQKYVVEYFEKSLKIASGKGFSWLSGCDWTQGKFLWIYETRMPLFLTERIPNPKRPDIGALLLEKGLKYYDVYGFLDSSNGVCSDNRDFVHHNEDATDFKNEWLHDISLRLGVKQYDK